MVRASRRRSLPLIATSVILGSGLTFASSATAQTIVDETLPPQPTVPVDTTDSPLSTAPGAAPVENYIVIVDDDAVVSDSDAVQIVEDALPDDAEIVSDHTDVAPIVTVDMTADDAESLEHEPGIRAVIPNVTVSTMVDESTAQSGPTWGLDRIDQRQRGNRLNGQYAYPSSAGSGVDVYIVDTGIRATHQNFTGRVTHQVSTVVTGYDSITDEYIFDSSTADCDGHGTHVAGTAAGTTWGVAKRANIVSVRVFGCFGSGPLESILFGIHEIIDRVQANPNRPAVANFSLGFYLPGSGLSQSDVNVLDSFIGDLTQAGVTVVAAAGNNGGNACNFWPARSPSAITVAATTDRDTPASFSNVGPCVDIFAPGVGITSASLRTDRASRSLDGTSMAAPHVTGAAALILGEHPTFTPAQVTAALLSDASLDKVTWLSTDPRLVLRDSTPNKLLFVPSLSFSPTSVPRAQVGARYRYDLRPIGGLAPFTITATDLPPGLTITGARISGVATTRGEFTTTVSVTDADGSVVPPRQFTFTVNPPAPGSFSRSAVTNGQANVAAASSLSWMPSTNADYYEICVNTVQSCTSWVRVDATSYVLPGLTPGTRYFWQVRAVNPTRTVTSSGRWWSFTTAF